MGTMTRDVHLLGTSLKLYKGERVLLRDPTNLPDIGRTQYFACRYPGDYADFEFPILIDGADVNVEKG